MMFRSRAIANAGALLYELGNQTTAQNLPPRQKASVIQRVKTMRVSAILIAALVALTSLSAPASAKGCIKGAIVGGAAGHYAGHHGAMGAAAGCLVGRHYANKRARANQNQQ